MKALVGAFNQEKALVGAFSVIVQPVVEPMEHYTALITIYNKSREPSLCVILTICPADVGCVITPHSIILKTIIVAHS